MKRYDKYKDSGIDWIGEIPEHWVAKKVKYCFSFKTGFTPPSGKNSYYTNGTHVWINISDLNKKTVENSENKITDKALEDFNPDVVLKGSLLFSFKLSVGKVAFSGNDCYTNEAIFAIRPTPNICNGFLYYSLPNQIIKNANENIYGAKILNQELIKNAFILIPPLSEQTAIASYLDRKTAEIDQLIKEKEKLLLLYEEEKTAIINQAVTKGINPNTKMKNSGIDWLGEIPEHWEVKKLKYLVKINAEALSEKTDESTMIKYIDIGNVEYGKLKEKPKELTFKEAPSRARRIVKGGDTLISTVRTYLKAILFIEPEDNLIASTGFAVLSPNSRFIPEYLFYVLSSEIILQNITASSVGVSYPAINAGEIGEMKIAFPEKEEQIQIMQSIGEGIEHIDNELNIIKTLIELLKEYKNSIITEVSTGKLKVI